MTPLPPQLVHAADDDDAPDTEEEPSGVRSERPLVLRSAFQPIYSVAHAKPIGYEGLLRGLDEKGVVSAGQALQRLAQNHALNEIEERCARLHLSSFKQLNTPAQLFLNMSPEVLPARDKVLSSFGNWLDEAEVHGSQVVVEIVEKATQSESALASAIQGFRALGCLIAVDDFGAGESNFERIWRMRPDIVKLDREMLTEACRHRHVRDLLPGIVSLLHETGSLVVLEGIETEQQALIAMESDVDFVQGYLFCTPSETPPEVGHAREVFQTVTDKFRRSSLKSAEKEETFFTTYRGPFQQAVRNLQAGRPLEHAADSLLAMPSVQRVYLLDDEGKQVGRNCERDALAENEGLFFLDFLAGGGDWFRRPYFQRAIARPSELQVSRPYLSVRDGQRCMTLSMAFRVLDHLRVMCLDLDHAPGW